VTVEDVPFAAGTEVEIILIAKDEPRDVANRYPLRGQPISFSDPAALLDPLCEVDQLPRTERVPGTAKGQFVVPEDFDAPLDFAE